MPQPTVLHRHLALCHMAFAAILVLTSWLSLPMMFVHNRPALYKGPLTLKPRKSSTNAQRLTLGYVRVSSESQADKGISLHAQEAKIASYAVAMDWQVSEVIHDPGASAKSLARPGMARLLALVQDGKVERIIVTKLDRLTRSTGDLSTLLSLFAKHDVALVSIGETLDTSTAAGRMVTNMLGVVAQWEREAIGERTSTALSHLRSQRRAYAKTPFGYRREGNALVPDNHEQTALAQALIMDKAGQSFRAIGKMLSDICPSRNWHASTVRAVLRSRMASEALGAA